MIKQSIRNTCSLPKIFTYLYGVPVVILHVFPFLVRIVLSATISEKNDVRFVLTPTCFVWGSCFIYVICIYLRIPMSNAISISDVMMFVLFNNNTTGITCSVEIGKPSGAPLYTPRFLVGLVLLNLLFSVQCFVDRYLSFCTSSFSHCIICTSHYPRPFGIFKLIRTIMSLPAQLCQSLSPLWDSRRL